MTIVPAIAVIAAAATGGFTQRASGLGFSLIVAPILALAVGPREGIALANLLAVTVALAVFATSARNLDAAKSAILVPAGLVGAIPGTVVFRLLPAGPLQVAVGTVTGLGLVTAAIARRRLRAAPRLATTAAAGLASGFTSAVAGAGGPPLTIYAIATDWPQPQFAATGQISYAIQAATALGLNGIPPIPVAWLGAAIAAAIAGIMTAHLLASRIDAGRARHAAIAIATVATALTLARGVSSWLGLLPDLLAPRLIRRDHHEVGDERGDFAVAGRT